GVWGGERPRSRQQEKTPPTRQPTETPKGGGADRTPQITLPKGPTTNLVDREAVAPQLGNLMHEQAKKNAPSTAENPNPDAVRLIPFGTEAPARYGDMVRDARTLDNIEIMPLEEAS